jgi:hypothetical protein
MMQSRERDAAPGRRPTISRQRGRLAVFFLFFFAVLGVFGRAQADSVPELEARFLELTQALRAHPAQVLATLFPESSFPLQQSPLFQTLAVRGMPRFVVHEALTRTADDTLQGLLSQAEAGAAAFDLPPLTDRLTQHGYPFVEKGEIIAALTFRNFVQPEAAAEALFRDVLTKELSMLDLRRTVLLNPHVREIGLSCRAAKVIVNGVAQNAYVLVVDASAHVLHSLELQLFKELNRWRQHPGSGLFPVLLSTVTGNPGPYDLEPVPVLVWDAKLYEEGRFLGASALGLESGVPQPLDTDLSPWAPLPSPVHVSIPLDVSMGLDQVVAGLWQALLAEEARRWALQGDPYALSFWAFGGALNLFLHPGDDGTLFLDAFLYLAAPSGAEPMASRLAGTVTGTDLSADVLATVQEVRLVSPATQQIRALALVDSSGAFSLFTPQPLYPPFIPYELLLLDAAGREIARRPVPLGLDGAFVEVVVDSN